MAKYEKSSTSTSITPMASWDKVIRAEEKYKPEDYPKVTIIIPTTNSAQLITTTLDSILIQNYPSFEVIIIDNSTDRTVEIIKNYQSDKIRIFSASQSRRYEMLNKGISQANGFYINFLFPGDFYIYNETLKYMMILALEHNKPHLAFCGTLIREGRSEVKILYREFNLEALKKGQQPTSLQSCWFRVDALRELGKFNPNYTLRGGFELMCRFCLSKKYRTISVKRVLTDYDLRSVTRRMVMMHFWETLKTVYQYFGFYVTLRWLWIQRDIHRFFRLWLSSLKVAFFGR